MNEELAALFKDWPDKISEANMDPKNVIEVKEVKVVDPKTGGVKGTKLARFSLIPPEFLWALAEHYGIGEKKYAARNWERGYKWGFTIDALERHLTLFKLGRRWDVHNPDCPKDCLEHTGSHHLIAAAWHCVALYIFDTRKIGTDDATKLADTPKE